MCGNRPLLTLSLTLPFQQIHGGDWGAIIGAVMTHVYPDHVIGLHNTLNHIHFGWRQISQLLVGLFAPKLVYQTPQEEAFINPISGLEER